jgi:hypothetical protein
MKITLDLPGGTKLAGEYTINEDGYLTVISRLGTKTARIGAFTPQNLARMLLGEQIITEQKGTA